MTTAKGATYAEDVTIVMEIAIAREMKMEI